MSPPSTNGTLVATQNLTSQIAQNNLLSRASKNEICTAFGIKFVAAGEMIQIAKSAGYHSLFIDLEHTSLTVKDAAQLCITSIATGITPFVRVPHECGVGMIQRVLDNGAMGVIVPHIHSVADAKRVVEVAKYAPLGKRSLSMGFPHCRFNPVPPHEFTPEMNAFGSTVFIMIETADALEAVDDIAAIPGCDVLLVGSNDLAQEIGTLGDWDSPKFIEALRDVGAAAHRHGKPMGIAGLYHRPDILRQVINEFGGRWIVGGQDVGLLVQATKANNDLLMSLKPAIEHPAK
ncbi:hypothetical protein M409DRAFT_67093 [Zasmidium cellare ATCC 36951]|uniref:HpcH/HpaI aldolase/citrate lyase domain-containing protein n=1 Tax=Zasmidium cellare ATCC 36951 TaxID=1080233 RepID=A0A6A6CHS2_ZASCE|nr:uncharacterized protein M409DRAFT_67093 [Zasmidium cellare ATCC 36951]KAF2165738.1 hypothetical protein M409DRAFT_67093 [Zasmidium cellare ATCC 36951]